MDQLFSRKHCEAVCKNGHEHLFCLRSLKPPFARTKHYDIISLIFIESFLSFCMTSWYVFAFFCLFFIFEGQEKTNEYCKMVREAD